MKKNIISILLVLSVLFMFSCEMKQASDPSGTNITSNVSSTENPDEKNFFLVEGDKAITIVCGENALDSEFKAAVYLRDIISKMTGTEPELTNDFDGSQDNSLRREILIGETNLAESKAALESIDEQELVIQVSGNKLVITGKSPRITAFAVERFASDCLGYSDKNEYTSGVSLSIPSDYSFTDSYYSALRLGTIVKFQLAENGTEIRPGEDVIPQTVPLRNNTEEGAYYTGKTLTVEKDSSQFGGAQFVAKLFTEGLSRAPKGEEYLAYTSVIEQNGCTIQTLTDLAVQFFTDDKFTDCNLNQTETVFAITRAILNRDPKTEEIEAYSKIDSIDLVKKLCSSKEFSDLLPDIIAGPYFWGKNNSSRYTGNKVITADELQILLNQNTVVSLERGTLVLVDKTITVPDNVTLETAGSPTHYTQMARFIRTGDGNYDMIHVKSKATLKNIFADGNFAYEAERIAGTNIVCIGNGGSVIGCRCSDSGCTYSLNILCGTEFNYVGYNLITCYASDHNRTWQDGLRCMGTDCILEYNEVIDATDAAIAVFRFVAEIDKAPGPNTYIRAQNTIVRYNTVLQAGNSSYASLDFESNNINWNDTKLEGSALNIPENPANFTGFVIYENSIFTSYKAHTHLLITMSTQPWTRTGETDRVFGGSVYNNYTPEGCHVNCAAGIVADGNTDAAVRGNSFALYIGNWCVMSGGRTSRIYSIDASDSAGDFQAGYENATVSDYNGPFISSGLPIETAESYDLREAVIHEEPQNIPVERFNSK